MSSDDEERLEPHPSMYERVTPDTVRAALGTAQAGATIRKLRPGVVRVEVTGLTCAARQRAERRILDALRPHRHSLMNPGGWKQLATGTTYRWRPWRSWVTVIDAGRDWIDPKTGLDYCTTIEPRPDSQA